MSKLTCPTPEAIAEERIDRVLTQYRESPNLLFLLRTYMTKLSEIALQTCDLPSKFDLDTAVGDQLTILGKRLGWPRSHCICDVQPVFGFECPDEVELRPVTGFGRALQDRSFGFCSDAAGFNELYNTNWLNCDVEPTDNSLCAENSTWEACANGLSELEMTDDETYRTFLKVRVYQMLGKFDFESLVYCVKLFFGSQAKILHSGQGRVVIAPGRELTTTEITLLQLYPRVLPIALGVEARFHFGEELRVFGFGDGWGGLCEPQIIKTEEYLRTNKTFGFCDTDDEWSETVGGFCETWEEDGLTLGTENSVEKLVDEQGREITTGPLTEDATWMCRVGSPWMCEIDVRPYECA